MNDHLTQEQWISEFLSELLSARPDLPLGRKFAHAVALSEWVAHPEMEPREAARQQANEPHEM